MAISAPLVSVTLGASAPSGIVSSAGASASAGERAPPNSKSASARTGASVMRRPGKPITFPQGARMRNQTMRREKSGGIIPAESGCVNADGQAERYSWRATLAGTPLALLSAPGLLAAPALLAGAVVLVSPLAAGAATAAGI